SKTLLALTFALAFQATACAVDPAANDLAESTQDISGAGLRADPGKLDFGYVPLDQTATLTLTIINDGPPATIGKSATLGLDGNVTVEWTPQFGPGDVLGTGESHTLTASWTAHKPYVVDGSFYIDADVGGLYIPVHGFSK